MLLSQHCSCLRTFPPPRLALQIQLWQLPGSHLLAILRHEQTWIRGSVRSSTHCTITSDFSVRITCVHLQQKHQKRASSSTSERAHPARTPRRVRACDSGFLRLVPQSQLKKAKHLSESLSSNLVSSTSTPKPFANFSKRAWLLLTFKGKTPQRISTVAAVPCRRT